ncbi:hypothetical protein Q0590_13380 [Rhodocytophaga aerolata]|uniref:Galactose oxidase n=1 Tax=Rhodocytophaga aerolata TaxID=455078 RepID=A0ABT8R580_9BACT|nr:hypothetical protein [Rhodocytophaga aerolata]MDO1447256.1 hypothetical protein [Rhodocytophaga aerolata]
MNNLSILLTFFCFLLLAVGACQKKEEVIPTMPQVDIISAFSLNQTAALARGTLSEVSKSAAEEYGIVWGTSPEPDMSGSKKPVPYTVGVYTFSLPLEDLIIGLTYYVRAYVRNNSQTAYSKTISFVHQGPFVWRLLPSVSWSDRQHTAYSTAVNGGVFVIRPLNQIDTEVWLYIPRSDTWFKRDNLNTPSSRYDPLLITLNKFGGEATFIAGGYQINENVPERNVYLRDCFGFDLYGNGKGWDYFDFPFGNSLLTHFVIDNRAYALSMNTRRDFAEFLNGVIWNVKKPFPGNFLGRYVSFSVGTKGYVLVESTGTTAPTKDFYEYDPDTDTWTKKADFPGRDRMNGVAFAVDGKGYYGAGQAKDAIEGLRDLWQYDPKEDTWKKFADFPGVGNVRLIANTIEDKVYMGLGFGLEASTAGAEQYSRAYDYWEFSPKGNIQ